MRDLDLGVAVVQRLGPDHGRRRQRLPLEVARPGHHAAVRHVVGNRQLRDLFHRCALAIPHFDVGREILVRHQPGIRTLRAADQDELAVRRRRRRHEHRGSADRGALTAGGVDERELAGRVIVEQRLIMRAGQQILVGADRRGAAAMFLDVGTGRHAHRRRGTTAGRHELAQQRTAIADPFARRPKGRIQLCGGDRLGLPAGGIADPQLDAVVALLREREALAVGRETDPRQHRIGRHGDLLFSRPPAIDFSVIARDSCARCGPLVRGLMRTPASRCIGCDS